MDQPDAEDLKLYIDNDGQLHERHHVPIMKNLMAKRARGRYDSALAPKAFAYLVETGAKKYAQEFADGAQWSRLFPPSVRGETARELAESFERKADGGELDYLLSKGGTARVARASSPRGGGGRKKTADELDAEIAQALEGERSVGRGGPRVLGVSRVKTFAGRSSIRADVQYPGEERMRVEFVGPSGGGSGPVVMILRGNQIHVSDPSRFGDFGPNWVRRFYAAS